MAINSFTTLKTAVADWLERDDMDAAIENMIQLMETRLYSKLRVRGMESAFSDTISSGTVSLPSDFLEFKYLYIDSTPTHRLEFKTPDWIYAIYPTRSSSSKPVFVAVDNDTLIFGPYPDSDYTVDGTYYARPTALSTSNETNFLTANYPDILLYGTLTHTVGYLGQDDRFPVWETLYQEALNRLKLQERGERFPSASALAITAS